MASFDVDHNLRIHVEAEPGGEGQRLRTEGLAARKLPELELRRIPSERLDEAAGVLKAAADYVGNQRAIGAGERIAIRGPRAALVVGLEAAQEEGEPKKGFFGRLLSKPRVLEVVEPDPTMSYPQTLLSTLMLWRAAALLAEEELDAAREQLLAAVDYFPGDPDRREAPQLGVPFNWENHLAYALLAEIDPESSGRWLRRAIERADIFELEQLGDPAAELASESRPLLLETLSTLVEHNFNACHNHDIAPGVRMISSPIWLHRSEGDSSVAQRTTTVVPEGFLRYYYEGEAAERLRGEAALHELIVDALLAGLGDPAGLALLVADIRRLYEGGQDEEKYDEGTPPYCAGAQLLSLLVADCGRRIAAGLSDDELKAGYGLVDDAALREAGNQKMAALELQETEAFMATMDG